MAKELSIEVVVAEVKKLNDMIISNEETETLKFDELHLELLKLINQGYNLDTIKNDIFSNIALHTRLKNNLNTLFGAIEFGIETNKFGIMMLKKLLKIVKRVGKKSLNLKNQIIEEINTSPFNGEILIKILRDIEKRYDKQKKEAETETEAETEAETETETEAEVETEAETETEKNDIQIILEKLKNKKGLNQKDREILIKILETLS
jgi:hypothetical protein